MRDDFGKKDFIIALTSGGHEGLEVECNGGGIDSRWRERGRLEDEGRHLQQTCFIPWPLDVALPNHDYLLII